MVIMENRHLYISNSNEMIRFAKKALVFLCPIFLVLLYSLFVFIKAGEFISFERIVSMQLSGERTLVGKGYIGDGNNIKKVMVEKIRPQITTLGNSRVLQFRSEFFGGTSFYNRGEAGNVGQFFQFLEELGEDYRPEIVIVGLEQSYFNELRYLEINQDVQRESGSEEALLFSNFMSSWRKPIIDLFRKKYFFNDLFSNNDYYHPVGINALVKQNGSRNDGSYYYGEIINKASTEDGEIELFQDSHRRIDKGINLFHYGEEVSQDAMQELELFLSEANNLGIHVVGFLPPYAPSIYEEMMEVGRYDYIKRLPTNLKPMFERYNHTFFDFSNPATVKGDDYEFIDGFHGSEKVYAKILVSMAHEDEQLKKCVNIEDLEKKIEGGSRFEVIN